MKRAIYFILLCFLCGIMFPAFLQAQENRKGTWLPDGNPLEGNQEITSFLKSLGGSLRPMLVGYDRSVVCEKATFRQGKAKMHSSEWSCDVKPVKSHRDVLDLDISFKVDKGELQSGGVAVAFDFRFVVSAPGVRELRAGFGDFSPSGDKGADWKSGDQLHLKFRLYSFTAHSKQDLYERFMDVRKALTGPNHPRDLTPFSKTLELTAAYKNKVRWAELPFGHFYRTGNGDGYLAGWVGGMMDTYVLLAMNDSLSRERVLTTSDFVFSKYQSEGGYFFGSNFPIVATSTVETYEHVEAISVGWGVTYALKLSQKDVESCPQKEAIFKAIRTWEDARRADAFPVEIKKLLTNPSYDWHLEEGTEKDTWVLYQMADGKKGQSYPLRKR